MAIETWDVYVTDNGETLVDLLHGVSILVYGSSITGLLSTVLLLGLFILCLRFVFTGGWSGGLKWFVMSSFIIFGLIGPKKPILVTDYSNPTMADGIVQDVPIGLAAILSWSSVIGDSFVQLFETAYGTVDGNDSHAGFAYSVGGMLAGEETLQSLLSIDAEDPRVIANTNNFFKSCVFPKALAESDFKSIQSQGDFRSFFEANNANALSHYKPETGPATFRACSDVKEDIVTDIDAEVEKRIKSVGLQMHPDLEATVAASEFETNIGHLAENYLEISKTGRELVSQVMTVNMVKNSLVQEAQTGGEAALMDFVNAQAAVQSRLTMSSIGGLMQSALPKMHSVLLLILVALFPVVITISLIPGGGGGPLKGYFLFFLNLQVWPLMFSIFTRIIEGETIEKAKALTNSAKAAGRATSAQIDMTVIDPLAALPSETSAIAAMMIGLIPGIAMMLSRGYSAVAGQVQGALRPINVATENAAAAGATGNINLGNANIDNQRVRTHQQNQVDGNSTVLFGEHTASTKSGGRYTTTRDSGMIVDANKAQGTGGALTGRINSQVSDIARASKTSAQHRRTTATNEYAQNLTAAGTEILGANFGKTEGNGLEDVLGLDISDTARDTLRKAYGDTDSWSTQSSLSDGKTRSDYGNVSGTFKGGANFGFGKEEGPGASGKIGASIQGTRGFETRKNQGAEENLRAFFSRNENSEQAKAFESALNEVQSARARLSESTNSGKTQSVNSSLAEAQSSRQAIVQANNDIESLDNTFSKSNGNQFDLTRDLTARAHENVRSMFPDTAEGRQEAANVISAKPTDLKSMALLDKAMEQAFEQEKALGNFKEISQQDMETSFSGKQRPSDFGIGNDESIMTASQSYNNDVRKFRSTHSATSNEQSARLQSRQQIANNAATRKAREDGSYMRGRLIAEQGGADVRDAKGSLSDDMSKYAPENIETVLSDRAKKKSDFEDSMPYSWELVEGQRKWHGNSSIKMPDKWEWTQDTPTKEQYDEALGEMPDFQMRDQRDRRRSNYEAQNLDQIEADMRPAAPAPSLGIGNWAQKTDKVRDHFSEYSNRNRGGETRGTIDTGQNNRTVKLSDSDMKKAASAISEVMTNGVFARSLAENQEYGGLIYRDKNGEIRATKAIPGFIDSNNRLAFNPSDAQNLVPDGAEIIADYHTHGRAGEGNTYQGFSISDVQGINDDNDGNSSYAGGFLINPEGEILYYGADSLSGDITNSEIENASTRLGSIAENHVSSTSARDDKENLAANKANGPISDVTIPDRNKNHKSPNNASESNERLRAQSFFDDTVDTLVAAHNQGWDMDRTNAELANVQRAHGYWSDTPVLGGSLGLDMELASAAVTVDANKAVGVEGSISLPPTRDMGRDMEKAKVNGKPPYKTEVRRELFGQAAVNTENNLRGGVQFTFSSEVDRTTKKGKKIQGGVQGFVNKSADGSVQMGVSGSVIPMLLRNRFPVEVGAGLTSDMIDTDMLIADRMQLYGNTVKEASEQNFDGQGWARDSIYRVLDAAGGGGSVPESRLIFAAGVAEFEATHGSRDRNAQLSVGVKKSDASRLGLDGFRYEITQAGENEGFYRVKGGSYFTSPYRDRGVQQQKFDAIIDNSGHVINGYEIEYREGGRQSIFDERYGTTNPWNGELGLRMKNFDSSDQTNVDRQVRRNAYQTKNSNSLDALENTDLAAEHSASASMHQRAAWTRDRAKRVHDNARDAAQLDAYLSELSSNGVDTDQYTPVPVLGQEKTPLPATNHNLTPLPETDQDNEPNFSVRHRQDAQNLTAPTGQNSGQIEGIEPQNYQDYDVYLMAYPLTQKDISETGFTVLSRDSHAYVVVTKKDNALLDENGNINRDAALLVTRAGPDNTGILGSSQSSDSSSGNEQNPTDEQKTRDADVYVMTLVGSRRDMNIENPFLLQKGTITGDFEQIEADLNNFRDFINSQDINYELTNRNSNTYAGDVYELMTGEEPINPHSGFFGRRTPALNNDLVNYEKTDYANKFK